MSHTSLGMPWVCNRLSVTHSTSMRMGSLVNTRMTASLYNTRMTASLHSTPLPHLLLWNFFLWPFVLPFLRLRHLWIAGIIGWQKRQIGPLISSWFCTRLICGASFYFVRGVKDNRAKAPNMTEMAHIISRCSVLVFPISFLFYFVTFIIVDSKMFLAMGVGWSTHD